MDPQVKVVVRHSPGAGGHFVAALACNLIEPVDSRITAQGSAHNHNVYSSHNYDALAHGDVITRDAEQTDLFKFYTEEEYHQQDPTAHQGIQWFKDNLIINSKGYVSAFEQEWHFIRTHSRVLDSLIPALGIDDTRLINVTFTEADIDQLCYNFVVKTIAVNPNWAQERADDCIPGFQHWYPHKTLTFEQIESAIKNKDIKFLSWVIKTSWKNDWDKYPQYRPPNEFNVFNVEWQEITSYSLVDRLDELADFLGITIDGYSQHNAAEFIREYAAAQTPVPFTISIDDY
jgi:hypothetical protein